MHAITLYLAFLTYDCFTHMSDCAEFTAFRYTQLSWEAKGSNTYKVLHTLYFKKPTCNGTKHLRM